MAEAVRAMWEGILRTAGRGVIVGATEEAIVRVAREGGYCGSY